MIAIPEVDLRAGLLIYASPGPRYHVNLRKNFEDFRVEEIIDLSVVGSKRCKGCVPVYRVEKKGIDTLHLAAAMAEVLRSNVNFAGLKDKKAYATQYVSARSSRAESPPMIEHQFFRAERLGFSRRPITRSSIVGNHFRILLRDVSRAVTASVEDVYSRCRERVIPNFYGYQRFGARGMVTHRVGREIIRRNFDEAVQILLCDPREGEDPSATDARELASKARYDAARTLFSKSQDVEKRVVQRLIERGDDFIGALRRVPIHVRRLFVHAYQSYLFNLTLSRAVASGIPLGKAERGDNWSALDAHQLNTTNVHGAKERPQDESIPLVQLVGYTYRDYGSRFDSIIKDVLTDERVDPRRFYIKEAEEMSSEGGFRHAPLLARNLRCQFEGESVVLDFTLGRGEYATSLLREIVKPQDPISAGF